MTVLPQLERELLTAHEQLKRRRRRRVFRLASRLSILGHTNRLSEQEALSRPSRPRWFVPSISPGVLAVVASMAIAVGIAAVFLFSVHKAHSPIHPAERASLPNTGRQVGEKGIDQALVRSFRILRRPLRPSDRLPAALAQIATPNAPLSGDSRPQSLGLVTDLAREATLSGTQFRAWLIPGRHGLCWDAEYGSQVLGAFCSSFQHPTTALTAANGDDSVITKTGMVTIGLVADRVLALELVGPNGQRQPVPITDGFYVVDRNPGNNLIATTSQGPRVLPGVASGLVYNASGGARLQPQGRVVAQIRLNSPAGDRTPTGIAQIYKTASGYDLSIAASGVKPNNATDAYAVWLYSNPHIARLLGFINPGVGPSERLTTKGLLPANARRYRQVIIALQTETQPKAPGSIILHGTLSF